jgi:hypothetical protein
MSYLLSMHRSPLSGIAVLFLLAGPFSLLWAAAAATYPFAPTWAIVIDNHVRLRDGPAASAKEIGSLDKDVVVYLDRRSERKASFGKLKDYWYHADMLDAPDGVALPDKDGWIFGASLSLVTKGSDAVLLMAISAGDETEVRRLLKAGANPNARTAAWVSSEGSALLTYSSALTTAIDAGQVPIAQLLVASGADVNARVVEPGLQLSVAAVAAQRGYWDLVHDMVQKKAAPTADVAAAAITQGNRTELLWVLGLGLPASGGVHYGAYDGNSLVNIALKADKVDLAQLLVEHGAVLDIVANDASGKDDTHGDVQLVSMDSFGQSGVAQDVSPEVKAFLEEHYTGQQHQ